MTEHSIYEMFELDDQAIKTYSTFPRFTIKEAAAVMLNLNPYYCGHYNVETDRNFSALVSAIDTAAIHDAFTTAEFEYDINGNRWATSISNDELREWAIFYGYDWKLKTFTPFKSKTAINEPKESENQSKPDIEKDEIIENLRARIAELENQLQKQSIADSEYPLEYDGDLPQSTNADKLADFIALIIAPELLDKNGKIPTYSQLYTKLGYKHPKKQIPSKNTIKKYLNQL